MAGKKKLGLPFFITIIFICIIIYLFTNIEQTKVVCEKSSTFDSDIKVYEAVIGIIDGNNISSLFVKKEVILPDKFSKKEENLMLVKNALDYNLEYLGSDVSSYVDKNSVIVNIEISDNKLVLLDNIELFDNDGELNIKIDPNTKSANVIALKVGDNYTDGELLKRLKNNGYACK